MIYYIMGETFQQLIAKLSLLVREGGEDALRSYCQDNIVQLNKAGDIFSFSIRKSLRHKKNTKMLQALGIRLRSSGIEVVYKGADCPDSFQGVINRVLWENVRLWKSTEGTYLHLYYDEDRWNIATNSYANAVDKYWMNVKDFRELFNEVVESTGFLWENLDIKKVYTVNLQHPDNRLIIPIRVKKLILVCVRDKQTYKHERFDLKIKGLANMEEVFDIRSKREFISSMHHQPWNSNGYMLVVNINERRFVVVAYGKEYLYAKKLKGNSTDMIQRIHDLNKLGELRSFIKFFPEYGTHVVEMRQKIARMASILWKIHLRQLNISSLGDNRITVKTLHQHMNKYSDMLEQSNEVLSYQKILKKLEGYSGSYIVEKIYND